jgi:hypothetical protein
MFEFIKNEKSWITPELMEYLSTIPGDRIPVWQPDRWQGHPMLDKFRELARPFFEKETPYFQQFDGNTNGLNDLNIKLPELPKTRKNCFWWFIKLLPGQMQTMHIDPHLVDVPNPVRYSMFLQDYVPGPVFGFDNFMASDYKAGDIFEGSDPECIHACVNVRYQVRYTLQITLHD